jgi:hypothetical protein
MRVIIVEDENGVAQNLCDLLQELEPDIEILEILETIREVVQCVCRQNLSEFFYKKLRDTFINSKLYLPQLFPDFEHV